jgi:putative lipase involved disintegration of autophagic bodies
MNIKKILDYCILINCDDINNNIIIENIDKDIKIAIYIEEIEKNVYIIFKGSTNILNIKDESKIKQVKFLDDSNVKVHSGFLDDYNSIRNFIMKYVYMYSNYTIISAGHFSGGALATLFATEFSTECVTFGCPKVGNKSFCKLFKKKVKDGIRIIIINDPIPEIFSNNIYKHTSKAYCIMNKNNIYYDYHLNKKINYDINYNRLNTYALLFNFDKYIELILMQDRNKYKNKNKCFIF